MSRMRMDAGQSGGRRVQLKSIADRTLEAIERGSFKLNDVTHDLRAGLISSKKNTLYYAPDSLLSSSPRLKPMPRIGILNFASARKPGGGFLSGAQAQEESIARSSTLYPTLRTRVAQEFYTVHNRDQKGGYYSHAMIYSPGVHIFRDDDGGWVEPVKVDVLTSAAVNAGVARSTLHGRVAGPAEEGRIEKAMRERMARILFLFETQGVRSVVLGSFGTGVFKNNVSLVANIWADLLLEDGASVESLHLLAKSTTPLLARVACLHVVNLTPPAFRDAWIISTVMSMHHSESLNAQHSSQRIPFPKSDISSIPVHHPDYYFDDGNFVILVENTLFNIFRSTLTRHSPIFRDLFSLPEPTDLPAEGSGDTNPLHLPGISSTDFERLLWILYPPNYGTHKAATLVEWTSILHLATRWEFTDVCALAIRELQALEISAVDKILLAREFDIGGRWTAAAYAALCERPEALTLPEAVRLGLETAMRIAQMREQLRSAGRSPASGYRSLTRSAAERRGVVGSNLNWKPPRTERRQWDVARSFFDQSAISPPRRVSRKTVTTGKVSPVALPDTLRTIAEAFGIEGC
ncbi:hypothetical protein A0H81_10110 [Grifola frondosa]|uniref:BTB domain-containing protein n=1 Tax=Grifola frondosa TaxID=5627 RepID=A0A1C7LYX3_GRIFR|nr:hypothetical protein A0H81_10110 [Grifola frondosa]